MKSATTIAVILAGCAGSHPPIDKPVSGYAYGYAYVEDTRYPLEMGGQVHLDHIRLQALGATCVSLRSGGEASLSCSYRGHTQTKRDACGDGQTVTMTVGAVTVGLNCER